VIVLHDILFVGVFPVNGVSDVSVIVALGVSVKVVHNTLVHCESGGFSVVVRGENLSECVAHLQLAVEGGVEKDSGRIEGAISHGVLSCWRATVVLIIVRQTARSLFGGNFSLITLLLKRCSEGVS
jgi:hypothetical protein